MRLDPAFKRTLDRTPTLPADEQQALAERYAKTRDPRDAQRLVVGNLRLVLKIARDLGGRHHGDAMDLVQEGCAGLADAVRRFDPTRGVKLSSYAAWWIRAYVMRYLMDSSRIVHFSSTREGRRRFFDGTLPGPDRSLDTPLRQDGAEPSHPMLNVLTGEGTDRPDVLCEQREYELRLERAIADFQPRLDKRQRIIFDARLRREKPLRLTDVGRRLAISGERARQIEGDIISDLRRFVGDALDGPRRAAA
jgi:RNA polymerase sigma-32 factor